MTTDEDENEDEEEPEEEESEEKYLEIEKARESFEPSQKLTKTQLSMLSWPQLVERAQEVGVPEQYTEYVGPLSRSIIIDAIIYFEEHGMASFELGRQEYPEPEKLTGPTSSDEEIQQLTKMREEYGISAESTPFNPLANPPQSELLTDFLDRYIPDWEEIVEEDIVDPESPERLLEMLKDLEDQFSFEIVDPSQGDFPQRLHWVTDDILHGKEQGPDVANKYMVRYYPPGTAAFTDPISALERLHASPARIGDKYHYTSELDPDSVRRFLSGMRRLADSNDIDIDSYLDAAWESYEDRDDFGYLFNTEEALSTLHQELAPEQTFPSYGYAAFESEQAKVSFIKMQRSDDAIDALLETSKNWERDAKEIKKQVSDKRVALRAQFAADVAFYAAKALTENIGNVVVAYRPEAIVGVGVYYTYPDHSSLISLVAIAPYYQAGTPGPKVRGIGSGLVCLIGSDLLAEGVTKVCLKPLDEVAAEFWTRRGFTAKGGQLCVIDGVSKLLDSCRTVPDCPDQGEHCSIGDEGQILEYRKPSVLAYFSES